MYSWDDVREALGDLLATPCDWPPRSALAGSLIMAMGWTVDAWVDEASHRAYTGAEVGLARAY